LLIVPLVAVFESKVKVTIPAVHFAYTVAVSYNVTDCPFVYTTDPPELVAQPANVYPVLENPFVVKPWAVPAVKV
jgi:hypothetical protein